MKLLTPILFMQLAAFCGPDVPPAACAARWVSAAAALAVVGFLAYRWYISRPKELREDQPEWEMDGRFQGALISPTRSIYSTHIFRRNPKVVFYGGVPFRVTAYRKLETDDAIGGSDEGTDVTVIDHEEVVDVTPVVIAESAKVGDRGKAYLRNRVVSVRVMRVGASIKVQARDATYGDSSSPVVDGEGKLISLMTKAGGLGPNLTRIRDLILG